MGCFGLNYLHIISIFPNYPLLVFQFIPILSRLRMSRQASPNRRRSPARDIAFVPQNNTAQEEFTYRNAYGRQLSEYHDRDFL
jgi:hypothetical protein